MGKRIDPRVQHEIVEMAFLNWPVARIMKILEQDKDFADVLPSSKTVSRILTALHRDDASGEWNPLDYDPHDARILLDALYGVSRASDTACESFTNEEAERLLWFRKAYPEMPIEEAWRLTNLSLRDIPPHDTYTLTDWLVDQMWEWDDFDAYFIPIRYTKVDP